MSVLRFLILLAFVCSNGLWAQSGALDPAFQLASPPDGIVRALVTQTDGKLIIAGDFQNVGGAARGRIARVTPEGVLDAAFATGAGANGTIRQIALQTDGKIIIAGDFTTYNGTARGRMARLNTDGTLDATFVSGAGANGPIHALALSSSRVLIGGDFTSFNGFTRNRVASLSNGSLENFNPNVDGPVYAIAINQNSDVLIGGEFQTVGGQTRPRVAGLTSFGSLDSAFSPDVPNGTVRAIHLRNGPFRESLYCVIGGEFTALGTTPRNGVAFLNNRGEFHPQALPVDLQANGAVFSIVGENTGNAFPFVIGGGFTEFGGLAKSGIARVVDGSGFNSDQGEPVLDPAFNSAGGPNGRVLAMRRASGRVYVAGDFTSVDGVARPYVARLYSIWGANPPNAPPSPVAKAVSEQHIFVYWGDPTNANSYRLERSADGGANWTVVYTSVNENGRTYLNAGLAAGTTYRYRAFAINPNGSSEPSEEVIATTHATAWTGAGSIDPSALGTSGATSSVRALEIEPDGKIVLGGTINSVHGTSLNSIARLNQDWSVDSTFSAGSGASGMVRSIARTREGKFLVAGAFSQIQGMTRIAVARLFGNGALDAGFDPGAGTFGNSVEGCDVDQEGRPVVFGLFSSFGGTNAQRIVRLNGQGGVDSSFSFTGPVWVSLVSPLGASDYFVGSRLQLQSGVDWGAYGRISAQGVSNPTFGPVAFGTVDTGAVFPDGSAIVAGVITLPSDGTTRAMVKIRPNGTVDPNFDCIETRHLSIFALAIQPDGKVVVGGMITNFAGQLVLNVFRLSADGTFDPSFEAGAGANDAVRSIAVEDDGRIVVGGDFTRFNGQTVSGIVRLRGDPLPTVAPIAPGTLAVASHSTAAISVSWAPVPGATRYFVEVSDDGVGNWTLLDAPGWQTTTILDYALTPGKQRFYRIAARNAAGMSAFSSVETATTRSYTAFESWNIGHGFPAETPEDQDADHDGLPQLVEFALGRNPTIGDAQGALVTRISGGMLEMSFTKSRTDVGYAVEASEELGGPWSTEGVEMSGDPETTARVPATAETQYLRLRVSFP